LSRHESERVRFLPWVSGRDLEELLGHAALFVLPSELEGLSLALLDAMAAGVCVLTSDIPENKEVVEGAGFTFRRGDRDDLAVMLDLLIHNPALRRRAAMNERERIQSQYLWPEIAQSIEKVYYHVLAGGITRRRSRLLIPGAQQRLWIELQSYEPGLNRRRRSAWKESAFGAESNASIACETDHRQVPSFLVCK